MNKITKEEFIQYYCKTRKTTYDDVKLDWLDAFPCDCGEDGCKWWLMNDVELESNPQPEVKREVFGWWGNDDPYFSLAEKERLTEGQLKKVRSFIQFVKSESE